VSVRCKVCVEVEVEVKRGTREAVKVESSAQRLGSRAQMVRSEASGTLATTSSGVGYCWADMAGSVVCVWWGDAQACAVCVFMLWLGAKTPIANWPIDFLSQLLSSSKSFGHAFYEFHNFPSVSTCFLDPF
jgi:hypothetical protein